jgi:hypothetical protein
MWQWCVRRSSKAVAIFASPNTVDHAAKSRLVVISTRVCSYVFGQQVEQPGAAGLTERQAAQLVQDHQIHSLQALRDTTASQ